MEPFDFSNLEWWYIDLSGDKVDVRISAPDSPTGAEQFLDSYNAHSAQFLPGAPSPDMQEALRQAYEQAPAYKNGTKELLVNIDPPAAFDPAARDGSLDHPEEPADLIDRNSLPQNTGAELSKTPFPPSDELPPQILPRGAPHQRSNDQEQLKITGADPVDLFTGEFLLEKVDFETPSVGFPFVFIRTYKSGRSFFGPFGYNWDHNYNVFLRQLNNGKIALNTGRLQEDLYSDSGDSVLYNSPRGVIAKVERQPLASQYEFILTYKDGTTHNFARPAGWSDLEKIPLIRIEDTNGNAQQLIYNGKGQLAGVVDTIGRRIDLIYGSCDLLEGLRPEYLQTPGSAPVEIKYLHANNIEHLSAVITFPSPDFPDGLMTCYEYDEPQPLGIQRSNITRVIDAKGQVIVENFYGTDRGNWNFNRVVKQYFMGGEYLFNYTNIRFVPPIDEHINDASLEVELYEPEKPLKLHTFNFRGNLLDERCRLCADGSFRVWAQSYRYNKNGQLTEFYHANGMAEVFTYDESNTDPLARGNLLRFELKSQPNRLLTRTIQELTYEPRFQKIKTVTDEAGETTTFIYDYENDPLVRRGNLEKIVYPDATLPDGSVQTNCEAVFWYDQWGQVIEVISPESRKVTFEYHLVGAGAGLVSRKSRHDAKTSISETFDYDVLGNVSRFGDGLGSDVLFQHNMLSQLTQVDLAAIGANRATFKFEYNEDRRTSKEYVPRGSYSDPVIQGEWITHDYEYDLASRLTKETRNSNTATCQVTKYKRDIHGRVERLTNSLNQETIFKYDERDLPLKETRFANTQFPLETAYRYDRIGNLIRILNPAENEHLFDYNENFSRLRLKTNHLGVSTEILYGPRDQVSRTRLADLNRNVLHTTEYSYDEKGRLVECELNGLKKTFNYDKDNQLTSAFDHLGEAIQYTYDGLGQLVTAEDPLGTLVKPDFDANGNDLGTSVEWTSTQSGLNVSLKERIGFDERNRPVSFTDGLGNVVKQVFDDRDLRTEVIDSLGNRVKTDYDINGLPTRTIVAVGGVETTINRWQRDLIGRVTKFEDAEGNVTDYKFDSRNNLVLITYPDGSTFEKTYDPLGFLISEKDANGSVVSFLYNARRQLTDLNLQAGVGVAVTPSIRRSFDSFGRLSRVAQGANVIERTYDFLNRVTAEKQNSFTVHRVYDDSGNNLKLVYSDGREDLFRLDRIGRVKEIVFNKKGTEELLASDFAEGTKLAEYVYDGALLTSKRFANGTLTKYEYDQEARLVCYELIDAAANLVDEQRYLYDGEKRKRVSARRPFVKLDKIFEYDELSRLTGAVIDANNLNVPTSFNDQAAVDSFMKGINPSNAARKELFALAANDKRVTWAKDNIIFTPTYNSLLQLTRLESSAGDSTDFKYDRNGNRTEDGQFVYQYDAFDNLSKVTDKNSGQAVLELSYDAAGRIVGRIENGAPISFLFDGSRVIEERKGDETVQNTFGIGLDEVIVRSEPSVDMFCHLNETNSLQTVTDARGNLLQCLDYTAFGTPSLFDSAGKSLAVSDAAIDPIFGGRPFLGLVGLYEFRKRFYDPSTGSFLQRDAYNYAESANSYLYCKHNPVGLIDPTGSIAPIIIGIAAAAVLGAGSGGVFGSIRQGLQMATGSTDEYGNVKDEFDWNELGLNVGGGGAMGIGVFLCPPLLAAMIGLGVASGLSEIAEGDPLMGAFDIGTSIFGLKGLKQFKGTTLVSRFNRLGLDTMVSYQGLKLRANLAFLKRLGSTGSRFHQQRLDGAFGSLTKTAELRVAYERVNDLGLRVGEAFNWRPEFLRDPRMTAGELDVATLTEIDEVKTGVDFMDGIMTTYARGEVEHLGQLDKLAMFYPEKRINFWIKPNKVRSPWTGQLRNDPVYNGQLGTLRSPNNSLGGVNVHELEPTHLAPPGVLDFSSPIAPFSNSDPSKLVSLANRGAKSPNKKS